MTTTATEAPTCPKCSGAMWDQKNGKYPYKPGTPIFKCKDKECATSGGVIWEPKGAKPSAPPKPPVVYASSKPESELPPFLQNAAQEDAASLSKLVGYDIRQIEKELSVYLAISEWYLSKIPPLFEKAKIGCSPESASAGIHTLFIKATK